MASRMIKDSWIREYLRYLKDTESPSMFHLWVAISVIASVLDRSVYINQGFFQVYPNLYIILVAGSQECRKSTAVNYGEKLMRKLPDPPNLISQKLTPESFIEAIQPDGRQNEGGIVSMKSTATIVAHELSVFITRDSYKNGLIALLVDLYDCKADGVPWSYRTKKRGVEEIYNNCINMIAASSPEYLKISLACDEIGGGFSARTIMVFQEKPEKRVPRPVFTKEHAKMEERLLHDLHQISKLKGEIEWAPDAMKWYDKWYIERDLDNVPFGLESYYVKKAEHLLAIAIILCVAEGDKLLLTTTHLITALEILEENEKLMPYAFEGLIPTPIGQDTQLVLSRIVKLWQDHNIATRSQLLQKLYKDGISASSLNDIIDTLCQANLIEQTRTKNGGVAYVPIQAPKQPRSSGDSSKKTQEPE